MRSRVIVRWIAGMLAVAGAIAVLTQQWSHTSRPTDPTLSDTRPAAGSGAQGDVRSTQVRAANSAGKLEKKQAVSVPKPTPQPASSSDKLRLEDSLPLVRIGLVRTPPSSAVTKLCSAIAARTEGTSAALCLAGHFTDSGRRSANGHPLVTRHIAATDPPSKARVLLISATHGDESSTISTALEWMKLMEKQGTPYDWQVIPALNPDGVLATPQTRYNGRGVDLNRNLPTADWTTKSRAYWRRVGFEKRRYPGPSAGSEAENEWLITIIRDFKPDAIITLHAPYGLVDYDGPAAAPRAVGNLELQRLGIYPGSLGNYAGHARAIPVITLELKSSKYPPSQTQIKRMWGDLNAWINRYLQHKHGVRSAARSVGH